MKQVIVNFLSVILLIGVAKSFAEEYPPVGCKPNNTECWCSVLDSYDRCDTFSKLCNAFGCRLLDQADTGNWGHLTCRCP